MAGGCDNQAMTEPNGPKKRAARPVKAQPQRAHSGAARPVKAEPAGGQPVRARPVKAELAGGQSVKAQPLKAQPLRAQPLRAQPAGGQSVNGAGAGGGARTGRSTPELVRAGWWPARLRQAVIALLVLGICGFLIDGANRPHDPYLVRVPGSSSGTAQMSFPSVTLTINPGPSVGGTRRTTCVLEAETVGQQEHGLMGRTSLGRYAGMVFVFPAPTTVQFYMKDTLIPLSLAWFDSRGVFIGSTEMPPCRSSVCPTYSAPRAFNSALEVPAGQLRSLGIGPGSGVALGASCG